MASTSENDAEDVNDFLKRIQELGIKRDQEDEERNRKLEEEILQGRKERQARRAERARSISPSKYSPSNTPPSYRSSGANSPSLSTKVTLSPSRESQLSSQLSSRESALDETMDQLTGGSSLIKESTSNLGGGERDLPDTAFGRTGSIKASPSNAMPSRSSTLSWQRRPTSQVSERPRSRPLSMIATENAARSPRATPEPSPAPDDQVSMSRDQIAQSLASKDPTWFRQTSDRGLNSAAYRKNQVEDIEVIRTPSISSRMQLPGMSREIGKQADDNDGASIDRSSSPSRQSSSNDGISTNGLTDSTSVRGSIGSPVPITDAQRLPPPGSRSSTASDNDTFGAKPLAMSPSQGRISPDRLDRAPSPTKGLGGFVQSAMMKRSDSVNKRWSVQSPPGLSRGNSIASNRSSFEPNASVGASGLMSPPSLELRSNNHSRDNSPLRSRPESRHSNATVTQDTDSKTVSSINESKPTSFLDGDAPPGSDASTANEKENEPALRVETPPPSSPSKFSESRRWSPTKSSWLESALNKPESPKIKAVASPPSQPSWMSEIAKAKQRGTSIDSTVSSPPTHKHEVNIGGLLRSPPMGGVAKPFSIGGLPTGFSSGTDLKALSNPSPTPATKPKSEAVRSSYSSPKGSTSSATTFQESVEEKIDRSELSVGKTKPETPPKKDFRSNLRSRQQPSESNGKEEPEFKNALGQLRRTKTQNYVAPDEFKDNILRGKAGLNITGGPKKTERRDDFKEAILKKKEEFKKAQLEGTGVTRPASGSNQVLSAVPEAIAKKAALGRSDTTAPAPRRSSKEVKPSIPHETSAPGRLQTKEVPSSKLADRFNPGLAGILARGPPPASGTPASTNATTASRETSRDLKSSEPGPQLTHMTKGRARGPRRKAPSGVSSKTTESDRGTRAEPRAESTPKSSDKQEEGTTSAAIGKPVVGSVKQQDESENIDSQPSSPRKLDIKRRSKFLEEVSNKNEKTTPSTESSKPNIPIKRANVMDITEKKQEAVVVSSVVTTSPVTKPKPAPLSKSPTLQRQTQPVSSQPTDTSGGARPTSNGKSEDEKKALPMGPPSKPPKKIFDTDAGEAQPSPSKFATPQTSPQKLTTPMTPRGSETSKILTEFFVDTTLIPNYTIDTSAVLSSRPDVYPKIKSLRSQLFQLTSEGKKLPVPSHQERLLFEGDMYLCTHTFGTSAGKKITEVYFWVGDDVPENAVRETELFARREARAAGGSLVSLRQGKETPAFIEALGGIVIIRRGSSNKYDSLAPHILCGRRFAGQIVFDEVDFAPTILCSGFPYLLSTKTGKPYLWKGKGSSVDELSCARLIGMDFGLTGDIEEIEDGNEPSAFLNLFGKDVKIMKSADHWKLKPKYEKYGARLFCAGGTTTSQITEITPFSQPDLLPTKIYILDAFFEIYIIVGSQSQTQYPAFCTALLFAQEYGILAAGIEDRPFVPVSTVVFEGVPRDLKFVFRKWIDSLTPTVVSKQRPVSGLSRGRSLRVVPLTAALDATRI